MDIVALCLGRMLSLASNDGIDVSCCKKIASSNADDWFGVQNR